ncbi:MAG TPA: C39 family peptidase, partial [Candidatus Limnocylindrales bacterium]|nr:C39 family peptidase [Candidatus Limnocylindrales bacterium]
MNTALWVPFVLTVVLSQATVGPAQQPALAGDPVGPQAVAAVAVHTSMKGAVPPPRPHVMDAAVVPAARSTSPALPASGTVILPNVPQYYQLPLSCEETSLSMALVHQGIHVSTKQILAVLGVDNTPIQIRSGLIYRWGDPDVGFVGNVYGWASRAPWGFFAYPAALVRVINAFHGTVITWSEPGVSPGPRISA